MKNIFENVIKKGGYDLTALLNKIDTYHIEGKISDTERDELYALARANPEAQYDYKSEIDRLWVAIRELQKGNTTTEGTTASEWRQPTGAHDAYMKGDTIIYTDGKTYKSLIDNNVWSPDVYPNGWEEVCN